MKICIGGEEVAVGEAIAYLRKTLPEIQVWMMRDGNGPMTFQSFGPASAGSHECEVAVDSAHILEDPDLLLIIFNDYTRDLRNRVRSERFFKIHYSLLPKYRGFHTSSWPIIFGDLESGASLHMVDAGIDTGDIVAQRSFYIPENFSAKDLAHRQRECALGLFKENFDLLLTGNFSRRRQSKIGATFFGSDSIDLHDPDINFFASAHQVSCQVRGHIISDDVSPRLGGFRVGRIEITSNKSQLCPGTVVKFTSQYSDYATSDYDVRVWRRIF